LRGARPPSAAVVAPCALTTRSTRTRHRRGFSWRPNARSIAPLRATLARRLPWFVRAHVEFAPRFAFSSAPASRISTGAFSRQASLAATTTTSRAPGAARRRVFHRPWLTVTFGLSSGHRNLRRSAFARQGTVMAYGSGVGVAWTASPLEHVGAVCLPTLCRRRRAARPNHAVNTDAHRRRCAPWWPPVTLVR